MSDKRIAAILDEVLRRVSVIVYNVYVDKDSPDNITPESVYECIKNIPDSLHCTHIFNKGKKKDQVCNVVLCPHHLDEEEQNIIPDEVIADVLNDSILTANVDKTREEIRLSK